MFRTSARGEAVLAAIEAGEDVLTSDLVDRLLDAGARVDESARGRLLTPLGVAVREGHAGAALILLQEGASANRELMAQALSHYARSKDEAAEVWREVTGLMVERGADIHAVDERVTPEMLLRVAADKQLVGLLLGTCSDVNTASHADSDEEMTPLMRAARRGEETVCRKCSRGLAGELPAGVMARAVAELRAKKWPKGPSWKRRSR